MALQTLPILIINLGGEMLYILEQRLRMQQIERDKYVKVLTDLTSTMCNKKFMDEVFKPQDLYTKKAIRSVFERLAHASIMRLNPNSMDKLYDLMVMVVKYQVSLCKRPHELLLMTFNHLDSLRSFVSDQKVAEQIDYVCNKLKTFYASLSVGTLMLIRQTLLGYLQDIRIRVSILLREKQQHNSGQFVLPTTGPLPFGVEAPGKIRLYNSSSQLVSSCEFLSGAGPFIVTSKDGSYDRHGDRVITLGNNIYVDVKPTFVQTVSPVSQSTPSSDYDLSSVDPSARAQLDLLSLMIGGSSSADAAQSPAQFQLNLFNITDDDDDTQHPVAPTTPVSPGDGASFNVINIDASKKKSSDELQRIMGELTVTGDKSHDEDDLLQLMDSTN